MENKKIIFCSALALSNGAGVLLCERPEGKEHAGCWEFPGGKIEQGETPERSLMREIHEELGISIKESDLSPLGFSTYDYGSFHLTLLLFSCNRYHGEIHPKEGQKFKWIKRSDLPLYKNQMTPADVDLLKYFEFLIV